MPNYAKAHGILMGLAFVVVLPSGAIFMRLLKSQGKATVWVHVGVQLVGWALMISGLAMGAKVGKILDRVSPPQSMLYTGNDHVANDKQSLRTTLIRFWGLLLLP